MVPITTTIIKAGPNNFATEDCIQVVFNLTEMAAFVNKALSEGAETVSTNFPTKKEM